VSPLSRQCEILDVTQPYRPARPVAGIALLYLLYISYSVQRDCIKKLNYYFVNKIPWVIAVKTLSFTVKAFGRLVEL
jgi:hypothetical protein